MAEYLNREAIMKFPIRKDHCDKEHANGHFINGIESVLEYVENLPSADVAPMVHGQWETSSDRPDSLICSVCKCGFDMWKHDPHNYCPNCGAKMDGGYRAV